MIILRNSRACWEGVSLSCLTERCLTFGIYCTKITLNLLSSVSALFGTMRPAPGVVVGDSGTYLQYQQFYPSENGDNCTNVVANKAFITDTCFSAKGFLPCESSPCNAKLVCSEEDSSSKTCKFESYDCDKCECDPKPFDPATSPNMTTGIGCYNVAASYSKIPTYAKFELTTNPVAEFGTPYMETYSDDACTGGVVSYDDKSVCAPLHLDELVHMEQPSWMSYFCANETTEIAYCIWSGPGCGKGTKHCSPTQPTDVCATDGGTGTGFKYSC